MASETNTTTLIMAQLCHARSNILIDSSYFRLEFSRFKSTVRDNGLEEGYRPTPDWSFKYTAAFQIQRLNLGIPSFQTWRKNSNSDLKTTETSFRS